MKKIDLTPKQTPRQTTDSTPNQEPAKASAQASVTTTAPPRETVDEKNQIVQNQNSETNTAQTGSAFNQLNLDTDELDMTKHSKKMLILICVIALAAGAGTGFGAFKLKAQKDANRGQELGNIEEVAEGQIKKGDVFGVQDESTFKDSAQGYLELGGIDGEGSHKLLRPGGVSQTVYLTSTVTNLDKLVGMEVKVWGETYKGQKAGWLMDVGKVEVIDPQAEPPVEAEL